MPVEPDPATYNIDATRIEAAISERTRVVIAVHLYGQPADMDAINAVAAKHGLFVLEDAHKLTALNTNLDRLAG